MEMFRTWAINREQKIEVYMYKNSFMATTSSKVIQQYEEIVGQKIPVSMRVDREDVRQK